MNREVPDPAARGGLTPGVGAVTPPTGIGTHYLRYSVANLVVLLGGLVSFPVLTRLLDNAEYGIMGYFNTWMMIAIAVAKFGGQHAVLRFHPHDGDPRGMVHFSTNLVVLPMVLSVSVWAVVAASLLAWQTFGNRDFSPVFWCVVLIVPATVVASIVQMVIRAREHSGVVMATKVTARVMELSLVLGLVILLQQSALSVFGGKLAAALLMLGYFMYWASRNLKFSRDAIDLPAMANALRYGMPLMANEFAYQLLATFDRVLLKELTGEFAIVGIYTIGYALAMQVNLFMNATLWEAFVPVANRVHSTDGDAAVRALKDRVFLPMAYASLGVAVMIVAVGEDLLVALSGPGKIASGQVFVVVGTVMALYPLLDVAGYGLLLRKRSMTVFGLTMGAAALNVGANLVLIPMYGYMGAAWATVLSYVALAIATCALCPRGLRRFPDLRTLGTAGFFALLLLAVTEYSDMLGVEGAWSRLVVGGALFLVLFALPVLVLDPRLRAALPGLRRPAAT